jgi:hypothetical protein
MPIGVVGPNTLKAKAKLKPGQPLVPPDCRDAIRALTLAGVASIEAATAIRKRYRGGEWDEDIAAGNFGHLKAWTLGDWAAMCRKIRDSIKVTELNAALGLPPPKNGRKLKTPLPSAPSAPLTLAEAKARILEGIVASETTSRKIKAEAKSRAAVDAAGADEQDAKKHLDQLRRAIMSKLSIEEQADLMVALVRGDNANVARGMMGQILDILGVAAANTPEAPGLGPIFALPEGAGPATR